jgi:hypothetical protein
VSRFAYQNSQNYVSRQHWPHTTVNNHIESSKIIDTQFHNGAGTISLSFLPVKTENTLYMTMCNLSHLSISKIHGQELLTLLCPDGVGSICLCFLPIEAANAMFITMCNLSTFRLWKIHDQESLMLRWRSFSCWGRENFTVCFAYKGSQHGVYGYKQSVALQIIQDWEPRIVDPLLAIIVMMGQIGVHILFACSSGEYDVFEYVQPVGPQVIHNTWPRMVDTPWTLIFIMGLGAFHCVFCIYRQQILSSWLHATCRPRDCLRYMSKNHWRSFYA